MNTFQDPEVRWGIIGAGDVCEVKSAPAMNKIPGSRLVSVMRRNADKAADYAERHGVPLWYDDADALIHDPDVNAIYIATPPDTHLYYTLKAAAAGKPVYVEKPMARTHSECQQMIGACASAGVPLFVAYYRRTLPHFLKIKSLIEEGVLGEIRSVHIQLSMPPENTNGAGTGENWRVIPEKAGGGLFYDLASHQLDYLDFLFGTIVHAGGISVNQAGLYPAEDMVAGIFEFENGVVGSGNWCFTAAENTRTDETVILGSDGRISYQTFGSDGFLLETVNDGKKEFRFELPEHIQYHLINTITKELLGSGSCPSTGVSAARTNRVMEQIVTSA